MDQAPGVDTPEMSPLEVPSTLTGPLPNRKKVSALTDEIKEFIVRGLARYQTPSDVADAVRDAFGVEVSRQRVHAYDPDCAQPPAQRWRDLHAAARRAFLDEIAVIGVARKSVRLRLLDRLTQRAIDNRQVERALALLEQAAKECGGIYDRRPPARDGAGEA